MSAAAEAPDPATPTPPHRVRKRVLLGLLGLFLFVLLIAAFQRIAGTDRFGTLDVEAGEGAYLIVFVLVMLDGICAVFPGETTLNTASTLASQGVLQLGYVILAGALGAVAGDSSLYWIARTFRHRLTPQLEKARANDKIAAALDFMGDRASVLLVLGRYVPGMRFVVNATFGLSALPYRRFLLWSAIGGTLWSAYTCTLAYLVSTAFEGFPLASIIISGAITTTAIAVIYLLGRRSRRTAAAQSTPVAPVPPPG